MCVLYQPNANLGLTLNGSFCMCKNGLFVKSHLITFTSVRIMFSCFSLSVEKMMLSAPHDMVNVLIGSIHTYTAEDQELVCSHTRRNQQEPHGRPGWFE